eukprot:gene7625-biopygen19573
MEGGKPERWIWLPSTWSPSWTTQVHVHSSEGFWAVQGQIGCFMVKSATGGAGPPQTATGWRRRNRRPPHRGGGVAGAQSRRGEPACPRGRGGDSSKGAPAAPAQAAPAPLSSCSAVTAFGGLGRERPAAHRSRGVGVGRSGAARSRPARSCARRRAAQRACALCLMGRARDARMRGAPYGRWECEIAGGEQDTGAGVARALRGPWRGHVLFPQGEQDTGAGVARAWRGRGAGCRHFFLVWGGAGVARACPVPPAPCSPSPVFPQPRVPPAPCSPSPVFPQPCELTAVDRPPTVAAKAGRAEVWSVRWGVVVVGGGSGNRCARARWGVVEGRKPQSERNRGGPPPLGRRRRLTRARAHTPTPHTH